MNVENKIKEISVKTSKVLRGTPNTADVQYVVEQALKEAVAIAINAKIEELAATLQNAARYTCVKGMSEDTFKLLLEETTEAGQEDFIDAVIASQQDLDEQTL